MCFRQNFFFFFLGLGHGLGPNRGMATGPAGPAGTRRAGFGVKKKTRLINGPGPGF